MAVKKEIIKPSSVKRNLQKSKLMDYQDTVNRGDSKSERTAVVTFSTTPEFAQEIKEAAFDNHVSKTRFIEQAIREYIKLLE